MEQIASMVEQLDQDSPRVPHVTVVHLENADPQQVQQVLQDMFQSQTSTRSSQTQQSPLQLRIQQNAGTTTTSTGLEARAWEQGAPDSEELRSDERVIARNL